MASRVSGKACGTGPAATTYDSFGTGGKKTPDVARTVLVRRPSATVPRDPGGKRASPVRPPVSLELRRGIRRGALPRARTVGPGGRAQLRIRRRAPAGIGDEQ